MPARTAGSLRTSSKTSANVGLQALDELETDAPATAPIDPDVIERVRQTSFLSTEAAWERVRVVRAPGAMPHAQYRELRLAVVEAERDRLLVLRSQGLYSSRVLAEAQSLLDLEETRLSRQSGEH